MPPVRSLSETPLQLLVQCSAPALVEQLVASWPGETRTAFFQIATGAAQLRTHLRERHWDAILHWLNHAGCTPATSQKVLHDQGLDTPMLVIADPVDQRSAIKTLAAGVHDAIFTDRLCRLAPAVEREINEASQRADHRAALAMLHDSEARLRSLTSNLPGLVFNLQREPDGGYHFQYVGEGSLRLLGLKHHELRGPAQRFFDALHPEDRIRLLDVLEISAQTGSPLVWDGRLKNGIGWIDMRSAPQRSDDGSILWTGIATDIAASKRTEAELRESRAQLAALSSHLEVAKEEERERIARDIHDELGSILVRLKIEATLLASKLPGEMGPKMRSIENLLDQAMGTTSRVARQLRPGILKEFGLPAAIESLADDFAHSTGISCKAQCDEGFELDNDTSLALFRIVQEALTNIAKHARATLAVVRLKRETGNIALEIRDNGRGIAACDLEKPRSFGLRGIRERVQSLQGSFHIAPAEQDGTLLMLRIPLRRINDPIPAEPEEAHQQDLF